VDGIDGGGEAAIRGARRTPGVRPKRCFAFGHAVFVVGAPPGATRGLLQARPRGLDASDDRTETGRFPGVHRSCAALGLLLFSCGSRTDLDVSKVVLADAASRVDGPQRILPEADTTLGAPVPFDATLDSVGPVDAGLDALGPVGFDGEQWPTRISQTSSEMASRGSRCSGSS
jgi:hypothetical protein